ncbi:MAG: carboxypeptidase-like regulatory domain-containing protein [Blastocatellia bacterium]|nr:carboxypeptidase-like regulatory domain-containing protein [Blastocatellia bacterium]
MNRLTLAFFCVGLVLALAPTVAAQTAATATVTGVITDPADAVVVGAKVELLDTSTNAVRSVETNAAGQYTFVNVVPGVYKITVSMAGFRQGVVPSLKVDVAKAYTVNFTLEPGAVTEVVELTAGAGVELQRVDATVGNVIEGERLLRLPNPNRSAVSVYLLQPLTMPFRGVGVNDNVGGQVAGARSDQNTFSLDGADATDNTVGTHPARPLGGGPEPIIPVPVESVEEFRVGTTNPNATFGRSSGGQITFVTKRGTNAFHGSAYWYHQNDNLNANTWTRNRAGRNPVTGRPNVPEPDLKDNRFGFSGSGPLWKDRTFIFGHYEGRRFPRAVDINRIVPTDSLRAGILRFRDASGNVVSYNLANSTLCGPTNSDLCDPRRVGLNPVVRELWNKLPAGNDPTLGDGLNTIGFRSTADASVNNDFAVVRLDHNFTDRWRFDGSFRYSRQTSNSTTQLDIGGLLQGNTLGQPASLAKVPVQPRFMVAGLTGQLTPLLTNELRFSWQRNFWWLQRASPFPQVPGTNVALQVAGHPSFGGLVSEPIDIHAQLARTQGVNDRVTQLVDNATWVKGRHTFQFGGSWRYLDLYHLRDDKVVGSLASLVAELDDGPAVTIPATNRPPSCTGTLTTNCLQAGDVTRWNRLYAGMLGIIDNVSIMAVRDGQLKPKPLGTPLEVDASVQAFEFYFSSIWRARPSLTLTYGVTYQWQTPPKEKEDRQTFLIDRASGEIITSAGYLAARRRAAEAGNIFNPELAYQPIANSSRSRIFDIDWKNIGPRAAVAWNPSFDSGLWGRLFGDRKTVLRGGYSILFDRLNTVQTVIIPLLGVGFAQTINCRGPRIGGQCANANEPANAFRIGVDGPAPIPPFPAVTAPVVPSPVFGELLSFQVDPDITVGRSHSFDFTIQRELPGDLLVELGYAGRLGRNLNQNVQISAVPFFMKDAASGQTLAQAFDAVAGQLRAGVAPSAVTPQPWFENQLGTGGTVNLATSQTAAFRDGLLNDLWTSIQISRLTAGRPPITNLQVLDIWMRTDGGRSNYHSFFVTLRKRFSQGLSFDLNYTLSKALDQIGVTQNFIQTYSSAYDPDIDYGPSYFDRRHVFNALWLYDLPFGRGRYWNTGAALDKLVGGWYVSGVYTANSGLPLTVGQSNQVWGGDPLNFSPAAGAIPLRKPDFPNEVQSGVAGSNGIGTASDPARGGSGLNLFANPEAAFNSFRRIRISEDGRQARGVLRGLPRWNLDFSLGKKTNITENVRTVFSFDFLNIFNRVEFADPTLSLLNPTAFGVLSDQFNEPRAIQFGFRVEW